MVRQKTTSHYAFDLTSVTPDKRSSTWINRLNAFFYEYEFLLPQDFKNGKFDGCQTGEVSIASIQSDAMSVFRTVNHIRKDSQDSYFLLLPRGRPIYLEQHGIENTVQRNEFSIVATTHPYTYIQKDNELFNNLIIPGPVMRRLSHGLTVLPQTSRNLVTRKLFSDFANTFIENFRQFGEISEDILLANLLSLLELTFDNVDLLSRERSVLFAHRMRIIRYIDVHFASLDLDVQRLAQNFRMSVRYIHEIFKTHTSSVSKVIQIRRISEACRILQCQGSARVSISDLALKVGFSNISHFSKVFKDINGETPSEYWMRHLNRSTV